MAVLTLDGDLVSAITAFSAATGVFAYFDLPATLGDR
jgi:hypothetical protein